GESAVLDPSLTGAGETVAAGERQAEPAFALGFAGNFLESVAGSDSHGVVLRGDEVDGGALRSCELEPGADGALGAFFGPLSTKQSDVNVGRFGLHHPGSAFLGGGIF